MAKQIGFYVWRGHWLSLMQYPTGRITVRGLRTDQVNIWRADCVAGRVKLQNP